MVKVKKKVKIKKKAAKKKKAVVRKTSTKPRKKVKKKKKITRRESQKRKKLAQLIVENIRKDKPLPMYKMMLEAGYSKTTAMKVDPEIVAAVKEEPQIRGFVARLRAHRDRALALMEEKIGKAKYYELGQTVDKFTKSIELLEGRPTVRANVNLSPEEEEELDGILDDNG